MVSPFAFRTLSRGLMTSQSARMLGATARRTAGQQLGRRAYSSAKGSETKASSDLPWSVHDVPPLSYPCGKSMPNWLVSVTNP